MRDDYDEFMSPSADEVAEWKNQKRYVQLLNRFPDCRDPDHPGCPVCNGADECDDPVDDGDELYCSDDFDLETDEEEE